MTRFSRWNLTALGTALLASAAIPAQAEGPTTFQRLTNPEPQNWLLPHRTYNSWRYSELEQITPSNVGSLKIAFAFPLGSVPGATEQSVPLVDEGFLYVTNGDSLVLKLDVRSGKRAAPLWSFDPVSPKDGITRLLANRGVSLLEDNAIINTPDGRVIALNRASGEVAWQKQVAAPFEGFTAQPYAVKDKVMVGNSKGDWGTRGYVAALAVGTGQEIWRFYTVPGPGEPGHETWPANSDAWKIGGASIWTAPSYDVATNLLYYGTSNASPAYDPEYRPGDNLYTSSTIVLNADSGKLQWYFQYTPNEAFEFDDVMTQHLIDTVTGGVPRKVVAHQSKNGWFYVVDRTNGAFINAQRSTPAVNWTAGIDPKTGKPVEYDPSKALQSYGGRSARRADFGEPGCRVMATWGGAAYHPALNRVYSLVSDQCWDRMSAPPPAGYGGYVFGGNGVGIYVLEKPRPTTTPLLASYLAARVGPRVTATDVGTGMIVNFAKVDYTNPQGGFVATKTGLIFGGHADGTLAAYDANTMAELWSVNTGTPLRAPPITFAIGGKQYIAVTGGGTSTGALSELRDAPMLWVLTL